MCTDSQTESNILESKPKRDNSCLKLSLQNNVNIHILIIFMRTTVAYFNPKKYSYVIINIQKKM